MEACQAHLRAQVPPMEEILIICAHSGCLGLCQGEVAFVAWVAPEGLKVVMKYSGEGCGKGTKLGLGGVFSNNHILFWLLSQIV